MKEYIRTTHNFNNDTREWEYRKENDKKWESPELIYRKTPKWSFGVHALMDDKWMNMRWIIDETIKLHQDCAGVNTEKFDKFIQNTPNYRKIIKQCIEKELKILIKLDMVRVRNKFKYRDKNLEKYLNS